MAIVLECSQEEGVMGLGDFIVALADVDLTTEEGAIAAAPFLMRLANNRELLARFLIDYLASTAAADDENPYSTQSFILYRCERYFVRANIWIRPKDYGGGTAWENRAFSYEAPHNHNFDFLTVNCLGSGYRTVLYDFDPSSCIGYPGEIVRLSNRRDERLAPGKVMFFRKFRDVHTQYAPDEELSVSLNLMISDPVANNMPQYEFDLESSRISNIINTAYTGKRALFALVSHLGDEGCAPLLESIGSGHRDPSVRAFAINAAQRIGVSDGWLVTALRDADELTRRELSVLRRSAPEVQA